MIRRSTDKVKATGFVFEETVTERLSTAMETCVNTVGNPADITTGCLQTHVCCVNFTIQCSVLDSTLSVLWRIVSFCLRVSATHFNSFRALHSVHSPSAIHVLSGYSVTSVLQERINIPQKFTIVMIKVLTCLRLSRHTSSCRYNEHWAGILTVLLTQSTA